MSVGRRNYEMSLCAIETYLAQIAYAWTLTAPLT
jgi:hypothetical protein